MPKSENPFYLKAPAHSGPASAKLVTMPLSSFITEHRKLIKLLDSSNKKSFKNEAKSQQKELNKYLNHR